VQPGITEKQFIFGVGMHLDEARPDGLGIHFNAVGNERKEAAFVALQARPTLLNAMPDRFTV
jgi:hypothetical protein